MLSLHSTIISTEAMVHIAHQYSFARVERGSVLLWQSVETKWQSTIISTEAKMHIVYKSIIARAEHGSARLWQSVESPGVDEYLLLDLAIEEEFEIVYRTLGAGTLHREHLEHGVDTIEGERLEIGQHSDHVRPDHLQQTVVVSVLWISAEVHIHGLISPQ